MSPETLLPMRPTCLLMLLLIALLPAGACAQASWPAPAALSYPAAPPRITLSPPAQGRAVHVQAGFLPPAMTFSPAAAPRQPAGGAAWYRRCYGFFCKVEWMTQKRLGLPLSLRLGSRAEADRLEGKP